MTPKIYKNSPYGMQKDEKSDLDDIYGYVKASDYKELLTAFNIAMKVIEFRPTRLEEYQQETELAK